MKTAFRALLVLLSMSFVGAHAQFRVLSNGRVQAGLLKDNLE